MAVLIQNRKARFDYEINETVEAGIELQGFEVKALKNHLGSLDGAYAVVRGDEAFLLKMHIPPYQPTNTPGDYEPERTRRLLLTKKEILSLGLLEQQKGLTLVPLSVYNKGRTLKVELGVARGKKKFDKRETLKKRTVDRELKRDL